MVKSSAFPSLERKPGGPDNWVEQTGGLPKYIDRIARHLHYEQGMSISHAIATAVNTVKRWARKGGVVKYGDKNNKHVTTITAAQAAAAVAEWESKKAMARALPGTPRGAKMGARRTIGLAEETLEISALAARANAVADPQRRAAARLAVLELAMTKDGRRSYKGVGKHKAPYQFKHGFIPVTHAAVVSKAKGSPIAEKRVTRLYGAGKATGNAKQTPSGPRSTANRPGYEKRAKITAQTGGGDTQSADTASQLTNARKTKAAKARPDQKIISDKSTGGSGRAGRSSLATKDWSKIPASQKTIRNGKKYVISEYNGKTTLAEWQGPNPNNQVAANTNVRVSVDSRTANAMSKSELQRTLRTKGKAKGKAARAPLNAALRAKQKAGKR